MSHPKPTIGERIPKPSTSVPRICAATSGRVGARERLLEAMTAVVARKGYLDTSVADVIAHAKAARSTFYEQFADLEECMLTMLRRLAEQLLGRIADAAVEGPPERAGHAALETIVDFAIECPAPARALLSESLAGGAQARGERESLVERAAELVERTWSKAPVQTPGPDLPAKALVGAIARLCAARLRNEDSGLEDLRPALLEWLDSYTLQDGGPGWRTSSLHPAPLEMPREHVRGGAAPVPLPRGRHNLGSAQMDANRRERILYALPKAAYERGYQKLTVADIAAGAGVSRKSFYTHFTDRHQAAITSLELVFEHSMSAAAGAFFAANTWPERMWAAGEALERHYLAAPYQSHLAFVELHAIGPDAVALGYERLLGFTLLFEEAYAYPYAEKLPRTISEALAMAMFEFGYREAPRHPDGQPERLLPQRIYICLAPFLGPAEATRFVKTKLAEV